MVGFGWFSSLVDAFGDMRGASRFSKQQRIFEAAGYELTREIYNAAKNEFNLAEKIEEDFTLVTEDEWNYPALPLDTSPSNDMNDVVVLPSAEYEETPPKPLDDQHEKKKDSYLKMIKEMALKFNIKEYDPLDDFEEPDKYYWLPVNKDKLAA